MSNSLIPKDLKSRQKLVNDEIKLAIPTISSSLKTKGIVPLLSSLGHVALKHNVVLSKDAYLKAVATIASNSNPIEAFKTFIADRRDGDFSSISVTPSPQVITPVSKKPAQLDLFATSGATPKTESKVTIPPQILPPPKVTSQPTPAKASLKKDTILPTPPPVKSQPTTTPEHSMSTPTAPRRIVQAASLADILGLSKPKPKIDPKWAKHYAALQETHAQIKESLIDANDSEITRAGAADVNDMSSALQGAQSHLAVYAMKTAQLQEVENALKRIERNTYGICELTNQPIEAARLLSSPATRFSLEGEQMYQTDRRARNNKRDAVEKLSDIMPESVEHDSDTPPTASKKSVEADDDAIDTDDPDTDEPEGDDEDGKIEEDDDAPDIAGTDDEDLSDQKPVETLNGFTIVGDEEEATPKKAKRSVSPDR